tara:strand:- start:452 stop:709 length:258 start_codon:yes stop_codon:yes gene_type:complete
MEFDLSDNEVIIFNLIKKAVCIYVFNPLKCSRDDITTLCKHLNILIKVNNYNIDLWTKLFKTYIQANNNELDNIFKYVTNHINRP